MPKSDEGEESSLKRPLPQDNEEEDGMKKRARLEEEISDREEEEEDNDEQNELENELANLEEPQDEQVRIRHNQPSSDSDIEESDKPYVHCKCHVIIM